MAIISGTNLNDFDLLGSGLNDQISGADGADILYGMAGSDILMGGAGNDILDGGTGADILIGGAGDDTYIIDNLGDVVFDALSDGTDLIQSSISYTLGANVEDLLLTGVASINATGNAQNNHLTGNAAANILNGGGGADWMAGGNGDDTYVVDSAQDVVIEAAGSGTDTVCSSVNYALGDNIENLTLSGTASLIGIGNALANNIVGNAGDNVLLGGGGGDRLIGGAGNDTLIYDAAVRQFDGGLGFDTLSVTGTALTVNLATLTAATSIERIDLGNHSNQLVLDDISLLALSASGTLVIDGGSTDRLSLSGGWSRGADVAGYARYTHGGATVEVASTITVSGVAAVTPTVITSSAAVNYAENATVAVLDVNATADSPVSYSITGGADATKFAINSSTGVLTFITSPDYEAPRDLGADNVYNLQVTASAAASGTAVQNIAVTVTAVNDNSPVFTSAATANFAENGTGAILTVRASDADLPTPSLSYSIIGGADAAKFAINAATGALCFVSSPNFEAPTDVGANNVYDVQVRASDGTNSTTQNVAVTVTGVNDNPPVITSAASASFAENGTGTVIDVTATDADLPAQILTFSITGGADASRFAIDRATGIVTFVTPPDFELPADADHNNVYTVQVTASDGSSSVNQTLNVTVTNAAPTVITSAATGNFAENATGTVLDVNAVSEGAITYSITGGADAAKFAINAATGVVTFLTSPDFEAPTDSGADNVYNLQVTASTALSGTAVQNIALTVTAVNDNSPVFTSSSSATFAENAGGMVLTVRALDADLPTGALTYSITGGADAAKFAINASTGIVTFVSSPNFEAPTDVGANNVYDLQVTASDGTRSSAQSISVTVTNVNEDPSNGGSLPTDINVGQAVASNIDLSSLTLVDPDAGAGNVTVTLTVGGGGGSLSATSGGGVTVGGTASVLTLSGTLVNLNTFFDTASNLKYTSPVAASGNNFATLQVAVRDNGNTGSGGGSNIVLGSVSIDVPVTDSITHATPLSSLNLLALTGTLGLKINGEAAGAAPGDGLGAGVGMVGDLNGDGLADVAFGAPRADPGSAANETVNSGATYVTFGARDFSSFANGSTGFDTGLINGSNGVILEGGSNTAFNAFASGLRVGGNGDFNNDGFDDLLISTNLSSGAGQPAAFMFSGASSVVSSNRLTLDTINGTQGAAFHGNSANQGFTMVAANAGDLNGDGRDDLIFGEFNDVVGASTKQGTGYVVFGNTTSALNSLGALSSNAGVLKLTHGTSGDLGTAVASAGDLNGDGYADLVIGAPQFGASNAGQAFVLFGSAAMAGGTFDLATLNGTNGFAMTNSFVVGMQTGVSVSSAGDINGDGIGDLLVGGFESSGLVGAAYVIYGKTTGFAASIDLNTLDGTNGGFRIFGPATGAATKFGASVAAAGDVNGDGFGDVVMGDPGQSDAYILFGNTSAVLASRMTTNPLFLPPGKYMFIDTAGNNLNGTNGVALLGSGGFTGESVSGAGDSNGDGYDDVFVGASAQSNATADLGPADGTNTPGQGYIVFGRDFASGNTSAPLVPFSSTSHATALANGEAIVGTSGNDTMSSGTFNGIVMHGGAGNDSFAVNGNEFRVEGGHGLDTLLLTRNNTTLDFTAVVNGARESNYSDIESIDMRGVTHGGVTLQLRDVLNLTGNGLQAGDTHGLRLIGDGNDHVTASIGQGTGLSWHSIASGVTFADVAGHTFTHYAVSGLSSPASLFIDDAIGTQVIT